jgi:PAS domain S-box-containing protein
MIRVGTESSDEAPESDVRANAVLKHIRDQVVIVEAQRNAAGEIAGWRYVEANDGAAELLGTTRERLIGSAVREVLGARAAATEDRLRRVLAAGAAERHEARVGEKLLLVTTFPVDANTVGSAAVDITDRRRSEDALRESEARYRTLFDSIDEGFCIIEVLFDELGKATDYRFLEVNRGFERQTGLMGATGRRVRELAPSHEEHWFEIYGRVALTGEPIRFEEAARALGRWYDVYAFRVGDPEDRRVAVLFNDIMERHRAELALRQSEAALDAFFASSPGILNLLDDELRYLNSDPLTPTYFGLTRETIVGKRLEDLAPEFSEKYRAMLRRVLESGEPQLNTEVQSPVLSRPGELTYWRASYFPVPIAGGKPGLGVMGVEITDMKKAEAALLDADRRKDEFIATLSHELRNPLAPIRNSIYILRHAAPGSEQAARAQSVIERQTEHLRSLVDDLLNVTRISHGKIDLQRTRVDLRDVVRSATDDLRSLFEQSELDLRVEHFVGPVFIDADATRITQVIGNLLQNAVKFTLPGGTVTVGITTTGDRAEVVVRDTGVGIDPRDLERMFEPFAQADHRLGRTKGGLGLGLALVKGLVQLHGGSVRASSEGVGKGAEFVVSLPLFTTGDSEAGRTSSASDRNKRLILIIEDNVDGGQSLADLLALDGHDVRLARDGRSGVGMARELRPDVVLCDIGLPDIDGYEVARTLRADEGLRATRLVALTGYAQPDDVRRALDAGFEAHLPKPAPLDELADILAGAS